jgi:transcriptional regulator with XRE-family HTH domain
MANDITKESISERIRRLRIQKGISQKEFADQIGLHPAQYNRYEKGENIPSTDILGKLADALNVSFDYLYEGQKEDAITADFEDRELLQMFKEIEKLSTDKKEHIKYTLKSYIKAEKHELVSAS